MPTRDHAPIGAPCWVDLMTSDTGRSRSFYCGLLGWEAEEADEAHGGYFNFTKDGVRVAGCMSSQPGAGPDTWSVYLATDDATKTVEAAAANGGQVILPPHPVDDLGTMAVVTDPGGATVGIWQPGTHRGFEVIGEAGAPSWFELLTSAYGADLTFYREVFRWETEVVSDTADLRSTIVRHGEEPVAGVVDASTSLPDGVPGHWSVSFGVDDTDTALARLDELGGTVVEPAEDTEHGRIATVADPTGARFRLVAPKGAMPARTATTTADATPSTGPLDLGPACDHVIALVATVEDEALSRPTPCEGYTVGDLLDHIDGAARAFTAAARKHPLPGAASGGAAELGPDWRSRIPSDLRALAEAWRDPHAWGGMTAAGGVDLPGDLAGLVALDELVVHGWDLARALGLPSRYDGPGLEAVHQTVQHFRAAGIEGLFGPLVPVPAEAPLLDRILGVAGRDPEWRPPS